MMFCVIVKLPTCVHCFSQAMSSRNSQMALASQNSFATDATSAASEPPCEDRVERLLYVLREGFSDVDWAGVRELPLEQRFLVKSSVVNTGLSGSYEKEAG